MSCGWLTWIRHRPPVFTKGSTHFPENSYRVEWAPSPAGPWSSFGGAGACWLGTKPQTAGMTVTNLVPMCYRVVATRGDYMAIDVSGGTNAASFQDGMTMAYVVGNTWSAAR